jgi:hypothetical protein
MNTDSLNFGMHASHLPRTALDIPQLSGLNINSNELDQLEHLSGRIRESMSQLGIKSNGQKQSSRQLPSNLENLESKAFDSLVDNARTPAPKFKLAFDKFELKNLQTASNEDLRELIVNLRQTPLIKIVPQAHSDFKASSLKSSLPKSITDVLAQNPTRSRSDSYFTDKLEIMAKHLKINTKYSLRKFFDEYKHCKRDGKDDDWQQLQFQHQMSMPVTQVEKTLLKRNSLPKVINEAELFFQANELGVSENPFAPKNNEQSDFVKMHTHTFGDRKLNQSKELNSPLFNSKNTLIIDPNPPGISPWSFENNPDSFPQITVNYLESSKPIKSFGRMVTKNSSEVVSMLSEDMYLRFGVVREPQGSIHSSRTFQEMIALYQQTDMYAEDQAAQHLDNLYRDTITKIDEEQIEELQKDSRPFQEFVQGECNRFQKERKDREQVRDQLMSRLADIHVEFLYEGLINDFLEEAFQNRSTNLGSHQFDDSPSKIKQKPIDLFSQYKDSGSTHMLYESYESASKRHSEINQDPTLLFQGNFMNKHRSHLGFDRFPSVFNSELKSNRLAELNNDQTTNKPSYSFKDRSQSHAGIVLKSEDESDDEGYGVDQFESRKLSTHSNDHVLVSGILTFTKAKSNVPPTRNSHANQNLDAMYLNDIEQNPEALYENQRQSENQPLFAFNLQNKLAHYTEPQVEHFDNEDLEEKPSPPFDPSISPIPEFVHIDNKNLFKKGLLDENESVSSNDNRHQPSKASSKPKSNRSKKSLIVERSESEDPELKHQQRKTRSSFQFGEAKKGNFFYDNNKSLAIGENLVFKQTPNATNLGHEDITSANKKSTLSDSSYPKILVKKYNDDSELQAHDWSKFNQHSRNMSDNDTEKEHSRQQLRKIAKTKAFSLKRFSIIQLQFQTEFQSYTKLFHSHRDIKHDSKPIGLDLNEELAKAHAKKTKASNVLEGKAEPRGSKNTLKGNSFAEKGIRSIVENLDQAFEKVERSSRMNNGTIVDDVDDRKKTASSKKKTLVKKTTQKQQKEVEITSQEESESEELEVNDDSILNKEFLDSRIKEIPEHTSKNSLTKKGQHTPNSRSRAATFKSLESQEFVHNEEPRYKDIEEAENHSMILNGSHCKPLLFENNILTRKNSLGRQNETRDAVPSTHIETHKSIFVTREPTKLSKLIEFKHDTISLSEAELVQIETDHSIKAMEAMNRIMAENRGKNGRLISDKLKTEMDRIFTIPFIIQTTRPSSKFMKAVLKIQCAFRRMKKRKLEELKKAQSRSVKSVTSSSQVRVLQRKRV